MSVCDLIYAVLMYLTGVEYAYTFTTCFLYAPQNEEKTAYCEKHMHPLDWPYYTLEWISISFLCFWTFNYWFSWRQIIYPRLVIWSMLYLEFSILFSICRSTWMNLLIFAMQLPSDSRRRMLWVDSFADLNIGMKLQSFTSICMPFCSLLCSRNFHQSTILHFLRSWRALWKVQYLDISYRFFSFWIWLRWLLRQRYGLNLHQLNALQILGWRYSEPQDQLW